MATRSEPKPMTQSERTRAIKQALIPEFGRTNVSVRQGQGTAHYWVCVCVRVPAPKVPRRLKARFRKEHAVRESVRDKIKELIAKSDIRLDQYMTDYGPLSEQHPYADCLSIEIDFS